MLNHVDGFCHCCKCLHYFLASRCLSFFHVLYAWPSPESLCFKGKTHQPTCSVLHEPILFQSFPLQILHKSWSSSKNVNPVNPFTQTSFSHSSNRQLPLQILYRHGLLVEFPLVEKPIVSGRCILHIDGHSNLRQVSWCGSIMVNLCQSRH